jgi:hypothetical protein
MIDKQIQHQQALIRYSNGQANTIKPFLLEIVAFIDKRLTAEGITIRNKRRLNILLKDTKDKLNGIYSEWDEKHLRPTIFETADIELDFQQQAHIRVDTVRPTDAQALIAAQKQPLLIGVKGGAVDFTVYTKAWKPQEIKRVQSMISAGFYSGDTNAQLTSSIIRSINGTKSAKFSDGILNLSRANIQSMVRTSVMHQASEAKGIFAKENTDIIKGEKIIATVDFKTTAECKDRDGDVVMYVDNPTPPRPVFHHQCRTTYGFVYAPEFDFLNKGRTRASKGAEGGQQVPAKQTYYTWLKTQPAAFQDEALGITKGKIFRNAGLSPDEFKKAATDRFKKPLTIEQMKLKDKRIAEYLGG